MREAFIWTAGILSVAIIGAFIGHWMFRTPKGESAGVIAAVCLFVGWRLLG